MRTNLELGLEVRLIEAREGAASVGRLELRRANDLGIAIGANVGATSAYGGEREREYRHIIRMC